MEQIAITGIHITSLLQSTARRRPPPIPGGGGVAHIHHAGQAGWCPQYMLLEDVVYLESP